MSQYFEPPPSSYPDQFSQADLSDFDVLMEEVVHSDDEEEKAEFASKNTLKLIETRIMERTNSESSNSAFTRTSSGSSNFLPGSTPPSRHGLPYYEYDVKLRPWVAKWSESRKWTFTADVGAETCRAYRVIAADRFLWVQIPTSANRKTRNDLLNEILTHGLSRTDSNGHVHRYTFGVLTDSKLKADTVGLFEESEDLLIHQVLSAFGGLQKVLEQSGPGKYIARLSLSFSSTRPTIEVGAGVIVEIPDLYATGWADGTGKDKAYTDGCGIIPLNTAQEVAKSMGLSYVPSVFQFRYGGQKGILVTYAEQDILRWFPHRYSVFCSLLVRPSQRKYQAPSWTTLEINDYSRPGRDARLNESLIHILTTLGLPLQNLEQLLLNEIKRVKKITLDKDAAVAYLEALEATLESTELSAKNIALRMLKAGHELSEPYVMSKIKLLLKGGLRRLRDKLSIPVPDSRLLFGCVDERGDLEEMEVYVHSSEHGPITGPVVVTRFPNGHPGDVLILTAIPQPITSGVSYRDVIVFSRKGAQPIPDRMSGGDLDGDNYWVSWNPAVLPPTTDPADRRLAPPKASSKFHETDPVVAMRRYLPDRLGDFHLGTTSLKLLRIADKASMGMRDPLCLLLVKRCELLMDAAKAGHGIPDMPPDSLMGPARMGDSQVKKLRNMVDVDAVPDLTAFVVDLDMKYKSKTERYEQCCKEFQVLMVEYWDEWKRLYGKHNKKLDDLKWDPQTKDSDRLRADLNQVFDDHYQSSWKSSEFSGLGSVSSILSLVLVPRLTGICRAVTMDDMDDFKIRASAYYVTGYELLLKEFQRSGKSASSGKLELCWLGFGFLNQLKADSISLKSGSLGPAASVAPFFLSNH